MEIIILTLLIYLQKFKEDTKMPFEQGLQEVEKAYEKITEANKMMIDAMSAFLFTWKWWLGICILVIPWVLWFMFRKKESSDRLLYAGFVVIIISTISDLIGVSMGLWTYPIKIIPSIVVFIPFVFSLIPVTIMFLLQIKPNFNPFIKAILFSGVGAYIGLPSLVPIDFYKPIHWRYTYSFFIFILLYLIAYWFSKRSKFEKVY